MKGIRLVLASLLLLSVTAFAAAQNADKNSAGPTKNDYRLHVVQPVEGARITGDLVQVVVDTTIPAERDTKIDVNSMPRPLIDVFLDEIYKGSMKSDANVVDLERVSYGPHTVTILAKNMSGEIVDRKVVSIITVPAPAKRMAERPAAVQPPPAPAPAPVAQVPPPAEPARVAAQEMPKTGTSDPLFAVAGLGLLLGGIAVRRLV
jgi:LPXTG-motif cell wall-anchored protein